MWHKPWPAEKDRQTRQKKGVAMRFFAFGFGYCAHALSRRLAADTHIGGTCRTADKAADLGAEGVSCHVFDGTAPLANASACLEKVSHLLVSIPPQEGGDPVLLHHRSGIAQLIPQLKWLGYLSTIGVYGDTQGNWVDEDAPLRPSSVRSRRRAEAENAWRALAEEAGLPLHIFRLAGIYGPERNALAALRAGRAHLIVKPGHVSSRIHVEDVASVLLASMRQPRAGAVYNVCDDEPAPPQDVIIYAARLLGMMPPPAISFSEARCDPKILTPMAAGFYTDTRRVSSARMKRELGVALAYPTYREGLTALAQGAKESAGIKTKTPRPFE
jgi:nucleoside-diphosphate-sugar epimerase